MKIKPRWIVLGVIVILLLALGLWAGSKALRLWGHLQSLQATLPRLEARANPDALGDLQAADFAALQADFLTLADDLSAIRDEATPFLPLTRLLGWVPTYGGDIQAAPDLLDVAVGVAQAGRTTLEGLQPLLAAWQQPPAAATGSLLERMLPPLVEARPRLAQAQAELAQVTAARAALDVSHLSPRLGELVARLDRYLPLLNLAVQAAQLAPNLLGATGPRSYLVLAQNNAELRATGGFISGVGLLRLDRGRIVELSFQDSYAVDDFSKPHPAPPPPLLKYMKAEILVLRDANWWPDFPTSAQALRELYLLDQGVAVDGVIAADLTAIELLVGALGPLRLEGYDEPVTGQNVLAFMQAMWEAPPEGPSFDVWATRQRELRREWLRHRKDFMGILMNGILARLESGEELPLSRLVWAVKRSLDEKHVLIQVNDPQAAALLAAAGWDGTLRPGEGDFLLVVDSNVGFNKANPRIEQGIIYRVALEGERPRAELTLRYRHTSTVHLEECLHEPYYGESFEEMMDRCYFDYVRVYVPAGSVLREASGFEPDSVESLAGEQGTQVFAGFLVMAPGEEREVTLSYELPATVMTDGTYRLRMQKQPGTGALPLRVQVTGAAEAEFKATLATDQEFVVQW
ncbi:MAG: DUF4012 domain-containing protein [Anaerolineae bacterium]|nr:DUF4012 domain-containing protein [Anaerolineae bacterium]